LTLGRIAEEIADAFVSCPPRVCQVRIAALERVTESVMHTLREADVLATMDEHSAGCDLWTLNGTDDIRHLACGLRGPDNELVNGIPCPHRRAR
jgi:hypothetical protein